MIYTKGIRLATTTMNNSNMTEQCESKISTQTFKSISKGGEVITRAGVKLYM